MQIGEIVLLKRILIKAFIVLSKCIIPLFYSKKYLSGKWFGKNPAGWLWCWRRLFMQKVLGFNRHVPWPASHMNAIGNVRNIHFHVDDLNNFQQHGCYFQTWGDKGEIWIGKGSYIAPNVGIITRNHDLYNLDEHQGAEDVVIGDKCWIGMNSVLLPGVVLGENIIVGAGSVVTKSFPEGYCVIAGVPAKVIKVLEKRPHINNDDLISNK